MARIRTIKPDFFRDEKLQDIEAENPTLRPMLVFAGLWTVADKNGVFEWMPRSLKLDILPFLEFDMSASLALLQRFSLIYRFEVSGKFYGAVLNFSKHQRINGKEAISDSKFPKPSPGSIGEAPEQQPRSQEGKGREEEREGNGLDAAVFEIAKCHPKITDPFHVSNEIEVAIVEAIDRHGKDAVWAGTKCYQEAVAAWPIAERQFAVNPQKFFRESKYLTDPREWERKPNGTEPAVNKATTRATEIHNSIDAGIRSDLSRRAATDGSELEERAGRALSR